MDYLFKIWDCCDVLFSRLSSEWYCLKKTWQPSYRPLWPDLGRNFHFWKIFKSLAKFWGFCSIWPNFKPSFAKNFGVWANFRCWKWVEYRENNLAIWSHCFLLLPVATSHHSPFIVCSKRVMVLTRRTHKQLRLKMFQKGKKITSKKVGEQFNGFSVSPFWIAWPWSSLVEGDEQLDQHVLNDAISVLHNFFNLSFAQQLTTWADTIFISFYWRAPWLGCY